MNEIGPPTTPPPAPQPGPAPGWYPDPSGPGFVRYWDGTNWTNHRSATGGGFPATQKTNGMAIASMVLGILWIYWIGSVLALVFGYISLSQIKKSNGTESGRGMAIAGIVLGWIGVAVAIIVIIIVVASSGDDFDYRSR